MTSQSKIIFCDLDGTLVNQNEPRHYKDIEALKKFQEAGYIVCINTGRSFFEVEPLFDILPFDYLCLNNGGEIRTAEKILVKHEIPHETGVNILNLLLEHESLHIFYTTDDEALGYYQGKTYTYTNLLQPLECDFKEKMKNTHNFAILCMYNEGDFNLTKSLMNTINEVYGHDVIAHQNEHFVDIVPQGCSKKTAVLDMKLLLPDAMTYGIGDSYNDLPMFEVCDESATLYHGSVQAKHTYHYVYEFVEDILGDKL